MPGVFARIGIAGVGKMGLLHLEKFLKAERSHVVGFVEESDERAQWVTKTYGIPRLENFSHLLEEVDGVVIAVPTPQHFGFASLAVRKGIPCLLEKPGCESTAQLEKLVADACKHRSILQVGYLERIRFAELAGPHRFYPVRFIESHRLTPSLGRDSAADVVSDILVHDIDLVLSLVGEEPTSVSAVGVPVITQAWDLANLRMEFANGAVADITASRVSKEVFRKFRVFGTDEYGSFNLATNTFEITTKGVNGLTTQSQSREAIDALAIQSAQFIAAILDGTAPAVTGDDALHTMRVVDQAKRLLQDRMLKYFPRSAARTFLESPSVSHES